MASPAGVDLTNDYASGLGTKLDYGFAPAGGHTSDEPAYCPYSSSLPPYRWRPVSSMTTPDATSVRELDCRAALQLVTASHTQIRTPSIHFLHQPGWCTRHRK